MPFPAPQPHLADLGDGHHVRALRPDDVIHTALLHRQHLSLGLFPGLGPRFMALWHQTFITSTYAWGAVVVAPDGRVVAMALMTTDQQRYVAETLAKERRVLARAGALGLLHHPHLLAHFLRTRAGRYARRMGRPDRLGVAPTPNAERLGVIHAVVTDESARGRGCARALLRAAEEHAANHGTAVLALITGLPEEGEGDGAQRQSTGAAGMYDHLGWERTAVRSRDGHRVAEYRRRLSPPPVTGGGAGETISG